MTIEDDVKLFGMTHQLVEAELDEIEKAFAIDLGRQKTNTPAEDKDEDYYPQLEQALRREASQMAEHYEVFYCLERSIRQLVSEQLQTEDGTDWWEHSVPESVKQEIEKNIKKEQDQGVTPRSTEQIDYTTFGQLGDIIRANWNTFGSIFNNDKALTKILAGLNTLRAPIAHCCPLAPDEVLRLRLAVRDWFRLME
jgi:hypothetical protein